MVFDLCEWFFRACETGSKRNLAPCAGLRLIASRREPNAGDRADLRTNGVHDLAMYVLRVTPQVHAPLAHYRERWTKYHCADPVFATILPGKKTTSSGCSILLLFTDHSSLSE